MRLVITGGGTAGHIVPGLAVVDELRRQLPDAAVTWIGAEGRRETELVPREKIPIRTVPIRSLRRGLSPAAAAANLVTLGWILPRAVARAGRHLAELEPQVVLATGGYVSGPVGWAAQRRRIPLVLLEPNSLPGVTVRLLARWADRICTAFPETADRLGKNRPVEQTGAPVRRMLLEASREEAIYELELDPDRRTLLVMGGSLGARRINQSLTGFLRSESWSALAEEWQVLHSTGPTHFESVRSRTEGIPAYHPRPYIHQNALAMAAAELAVIRGGAQTVAEVSARGLPSVVIPWSGSAEGHQEVNARSLADSGMARVLPDHELSPSSLTAILTGLMTDPAARAEMVAAARARTQPDAADRVVQLLREAVRAPRRARD